MGDPILNLSLLQMGSMADLAVAVESGALDETGLFSLEEALRGGSVEDTDLYEAIDAYQLFRGQSKYRQQLRGVIAELLRQSKRQNHLLQASFRLGRLRLGHSPLRPAGNPIRPRPRGNSAHSQAFASLSPGQSPAVFSKSKPHSRPALQAESAGHSGGPIDVPVSLFDETIQRWIVSGTKTIVLDGIDFENKKLRWLGQCWERLIQPDAAGYFEYIGMDLPYGISFRYGEIKGRPGLNGTTIEFGEANCEEIIEVLYGLFPQWFAEDGTFQAKETLSINFPSSLIRRILEWGFRELNEATPTSVRFLEYVRRVAKGEALSEGEMEWIQEAEREAKERADQFKRGYRFWRQMGTMPALAGLKRAMVKVEPALRVWLGIRHFNAKVEGEMLTPSPTPSEKPAQFPSSLRELIHSIASVALDSDIPIRYSLDWGDQVNKRLGDIALLVGLNQLSALARIFYYFMERAKSYVRVNAETLPNGSLEITLVADHMHLKEEEIKKMGAGLSQKEVKLDLLAETLFQWGMPLWVRSGERGTELRFILDSSILAKEGKKVGTVEGGEKDLREAVRKNREEGFLVPDVFRDIAQMERRGRYRILHRIDRRLSTSFYIALDHETGKKVMIKFLKPEQEPQPRKIRRMKREREAMFQFHDPHIVRLLDQGDDLGPAVGNHLESLKRPFLVMEYVGDHDLGEKIEKLGAFSWVTAKPVLLQIAGALLAVHGGTLVHRDVSPNNVFVSNEGGEEGMIVRLGDFDIVWRPGDEEIEKDEGSTVVGKVPYMAPEQIRGEEMDPRTDIYAFGATIFEILAGRVPFDNHNVEKMIQRHLEETPPRLREVRTDLNIPECAEAIVLKAMAKNPIDRFQTMEEMAKAIRECN